MLQTLKNSWRIPELRSKLLFTLFIILIYRLGATIPVPFVSSDVAEAFATAYGNTVLGFMSVLSGGALAQATLFALSVSPYITASIVMQLLTIAIPPLERMAKDEDGKKKITVITRYVTVALALVTAYGYTMLLSANGMLSASAGQHPIFSKVVMIACYCAGASLIMWLAEKINEHGIGNGISMILFANILSGLPGAVFQLWNWIMPVEGFNVVGLVLAIIVAAVTLGLLILSVWFTNSERKIPIQYAKRVVGRKMYGGQGTSLPLKMNMAGVMPIIFASSIITIPATIVSLIPNVDTTSGVAWFISTFLSPNNSVASWPYILLYLVLLVAFSYFYIMISFNPVEVSNNIRNNGGAIPGIRPGRPTSDFIKKVLNRVTLIGAFFLAIIAGLPMVAGLFDARLAAVSFGGSSLLIVVGVALETVRDLEAQITMRNYKGFLD
ncbi:MAG: preprotein translocase subunit SecY [Clostridia bacterium]|nr:preprotein translocase subunit SecY [Clostridia bacterium]